MNATRTFREARKSQFYGAIFSKDLHRIIVQQTPLDQSKTAPPREISARTVAMDLLKSVSTLENCSMGHFSSSPK